MQYSIYFNEKALRITDQIDFGHEELKKPGFFVINDLNTESIQTALYNMQQPHINGGVFMHKPAEEALQAIKKHTKVIEAGGGFVYTTSGKVLLMYRRGKWDLPKGKLDDGEAPDAAALREVWEETGVRDLSLEAPLPTTYHTYHQHGELILKESHWYLMRCDVEQQLIPQAEEDIEKCEWVKWDALSLYLENTHPSIIDVLKAGLEKLNATITF